MRIVVVLLGPLVACVVMAPAIARCKFPSLEQDFANATQVYVATLVLAEELESKPASNDENSHELDHGTGYRFVFRVDDVFKGDVPKRVEKRTSTGIVVSSGSPIQLHELTLGTRVLMFEPHWDSGCSRTTVVDEHVDREILWRLDELPGGRDEKK